MKIEKSASGILHVIESGAIKSIMFESLSGEPMFQVIASLAAVAKLGDDVTRFERARISLTIESEDPPTYECRL